MNFIELLICIVLLSLLSLASVFGYQSLLTRTRLHADAQIVYTAVNQARALGGRVSCTQAHCVLKTSTQEKVFKLSGLNTVETRLFPHQAQGEFVFNVNGLTAFHNGTIKVTVPEKGLSKEIVVSAGGRVKISPA